MTVGTLQLFCLNRFLLCVEDQYCCQLHHGSVAPSFSFLEGKPLLNIEDLHKRDSPEPWKYSVQHRNESSGSCPRSGTSRCSIRGVLTQGSASNPRNRLKHPYVEGRSLLPV